MLIVDTIHDRRQIFLGFSTGNSPRHGSPFCYQEHYQTPVVNPSPPAVVHTHGEHRWPENPYRHIPFPKKRGHAA